MRSSKLLAAAAGVAVVCASGAAHAAHVGVYVGGAVPGYYAPAPYYYVPAPPPPPPPQYIERGPDGQPVPVPGPYGAPPYPQDDSAPYPQDGSAPYPPPQGSAPQYPPQDGSTPYPPPQGSAPQYPPDDDAPPYPQGGAPQSPPANPAQQYPQGSAPQAATPQAGGNTWYFCDATHTYYPYVKDCASGWRPTPAQPAQQQQQQQQQPQ